MLLTIDLPPHAEPYSEAHEAETLAWIRDSSRTITPPEAGSDLNRSLVVLQFPVSHPDTPETAPKVRAVYSSFEAISEAKKEDGSKVVD